MNTDVEVEEIKKKERRKVFWALNTLPWLLTTLAFITIICLLWHMKTSIPKPIELPISLITTNKVDNRLEFEIEAVSNKMGEWKIDARGNRSFNWITNQFPKTTVFPIQENNPDQVYSKEIEDMKSLSGITGIVPEREYPFTIKDLQLAKEINLDIEKQMINNCLDALEGNFSGMTSKEALALKKRLAIDITLGIKRVFDGFETWNKEKRK